MMAVEDLGLLSEGVIMIGTGYYLPFSRQIMSEPKGEGRLNN